MVGCLSFQQQVQVPPSIRSKGETSLLGASTLCVGFAPSGLPGQDTATYRKGSAPGPRPLKAGDRIRIGACTVLTLDI